jgi:peptidyl-prolyl cis-trans isomerase SurA
VLQLPMGFLIFKINDIKTINTPQAIKQYNVRHILIKVGENNSNEEAHQKIVMIENMLGKYKNNLNLESQEFAKLAKEYSEDSSSINGGSLGWVNSGDTVPTFEQIMIKTPIGKISEPFRTPFGWHILQVDGIRSKDKTSEVLRASIRQEIKEIKATLLYAEWLRNIRDAAYIRINDN